MIQLSRALERGSLDLFLLPGFRERRFPGVEGRLRSVPPVADRARYHSPREEDHLDWALRWEASIGDWEVGLSHFVGTGREPLFTPGLEEGDVVLVPYYPQIRQSGLDLQVIVGEWLWKLETISRSQQGSRFTALTGGFEYTLVGVGGSSADLGVIAEYLFDERGDRAPTPFQDDLMAGLRLALNDVQSTELLAGVVSDLSGGGRLWLLESSRRLGDGWKVNIEARLFIDPPPASLIYSLRNDDYLQLELARYF